MANANNTPTDPDEQESDNREAVQVNLIGTPYAVTYGIRTFSKIGYAKMSEWSALSPAHRPGLVKCTLTRYIPKQ